jgi:hypothetical protein
MHAESPQSLYNLHRFGREVLTHYLLGRSLWACLLLALLDRDR